MFGDNGNRGIIPRALDEIFSRITADDGGGVFVVKASMLEIYREELKDLLRPSTHKLRLRESAFDGIWVEGLHHIYVPTAAVAVQLLQEGMASRVVGSTGMNSQSSRSHCIFSLRVEQQASATVCIFICLVRRSEANTGAESGHDADIVSLVSLVSTLTAWSSEASYTLRISPAWSASTEQAHTGSLSRRPNASTCLFLRLATAFQLLHSRGVRTFLFATLS